MNYADKHNKLELIERLSTSLKNDDKIKEDLFYSSFGAFASNKPAKTIVKEIKSSRKFRKKEINF